MAYKATVIKVMIASPTDVAAERSIVRKVIDEWNAINAEDRRIVILPISWETHSSPDMGDRPQAIINKQLKDCDLLVAIFWTKLGSPSGAAESGTVEEINEHLSADKPAMIYFSSVPVRQDSVDADQYAKLKEFKEELKGHGLFEQYETLSEFTEKFARQLALTIIRTFTVDNDNSRQEESPKPKRTPPFLSDTAQQLLGAAVHDKNGIVMMVQTMGGTHVQTNDRDFVEKDNPRSSAKWMGAVKELERIGFVEDRAGKNEVFFVTDAGYQAADSLFG